MLPPGTLTGTNVQLVGRMMHHRAAGNRPHRGAENHITQIVTVVVQTRHRDIRRRAQALAPARCRSITVVLPQATIC